MQRLSRLKSLLNTNLAKKDLFYSTSDKQDELIVNGVKVINLFKKDLKSRNQIDSSAIKDDSIVLDASRDIFTNINKKGNEQKVELSASKTNKLIKELSSKNAKE